MSEIISVISCC